MMLATACRFGISCLGRRTASCRSTVSAPAWRHHQARWEGLGSGSSASSAVLRRRDGGMAMSYLLSWGKRPWESLVQKLTDEGYESQYLNRLKSKVNAEAAVHELEAEILQEMGGVLRKVEDKLNWKLLLLELAGKEISKAGDSLARRDAIRKFNQAREVALEARREMTIQREAAGMRIKNWERTARLYPIPPPCRSDALEAPSVDQEVASLSSPEAMRRLIADAKLSK